jgi:hypothetical protein
MSSTIDPQTQAMIDNLPAKTGKSLEEWYDLLCKIGNVKHGEIMKLLMETYNASYGFANLIANQYLQHQVREVETDEDLIAEQYKGTKADLKPIYEAILTAINAFGDDIVIAPKKNYVSLRRKKQFAIIQPTTRTRVDIGLNLKNEPGTSRLESGNIFNGMCSHLVKAQSVMDIDHELIEWLHNAYNQS